LEKCCKAIAEIYKLKLAVNDNPPTDEEELERVRLIKVPLTIEHPACSDKEMYNCVTTMLGGPEALKDVKMWGYGPTATQSDVESSSATSQSDDEDEDDGNESDREEISPPRTPPASQPAHRTRGDKRPPSGSGVAAQTPPPKKQKGRFLCEIFATLTFLIVNPISVVGRKGNAKKSQKSKK